MTDAPLLVTADVVGLTSGFHSFNISFRDVSNYAAAIADGNPLYYNSERALVHPVFPVRLSWQLLQSHDNVWGQYFSTDMKNRMVHYDEHIEYKNLVKAGDKLVAQSQIIGMEKHKLGTKMEVKITYKTEKGEEVITEYISSIIFGVSCDQDKVLERSPINIKNAVGTSAIWEELVGIDRTAPYVYDGCTDISALIHTDENYAKSIGLPGIIYHGTASLARCVSALVNRELNGESNLIKAISCKFIGKLLLPNQLNIQLLERESDYLSFLAKDMNSQSIVVGNITIGS